MYTKETCNTFAHIIKRVFFPLQESKKQVPSHEIAVNADATGQH